MREKFVISIEVEAYHVEKLALLNSCFFVLKVDSLITNSISEKVLDILSLLGNVLKCFLETFSFSLGF